MPWDLDMMFIAETHWPGIIDQNNALTRPNLNIEFRNRCREILDLMCSDATDNGGQIGQLIDEASIHAAKIISFWVFTSVLPASI